MSDYDDAAKAIEGGVATPRDVQDLVDNAGNLEILVLRVRRRRPPARSRPDQVPLWPKCSIMSSDDHRATRVSIEPPVYEARFRVATMRLWCEQQAKRGNL